MSDSVLEYLLKNQRLAVLSTQGEGEPYGSLVAFAAADDCGSIYFVTPRSTRKYANLIGEPRVALVIDNRSNDSDDFKEAVAATAVGIAEEVDAEQAADAFGIYIAKHPLLKEFAAGPDSAVFKIVVRKYYVVVGIDKVDVIDME